MSIKIAMELPTCKLAAWTPLADLDFILAHKVLEDKEYAAFFHHRPVERELILDNSLHELGYPLSVSDLLEAAQRCRADYVISPDKVGDVNFNVEQFAASRKVLWPEYKIAVIMTGDRNKRGLEGYSERENFLFQCREADMLCCTFKEEQRLDWYLESPMARRWNRLHLLGVSELTELVRWAACVRSVTSIGTKHVSVDTGKALKWALRGKKLDELESLRLNKHTTASGLPSEASQQILSLTAEQISPEVEKLFVHNVQALKEACK